MHDALEKDLNFLAPDLTESRYRDLLARFYGFYLPWEAELQPWVARIAPPGTTGLFSKAPALARDVEFFGLDPSAIPVCAYVPRTATLSAALGNLYVREGAALGGKVISRHLESSLSLSGGNGYHFFAGAGRDVVQDWKRFGNVLLDHSSRGHDDEIIEGARSAFEAIHRWLCV